MTTCGIGFSGTVGNATGCFGATFGSGSAGFAAGLGAGFSAFGAGFASAFGASLGEVFASATLAGAFSATGTAGFLP